MSGPARRTRPPGAAELGGYREFYSGQAERFSEIMHSTLEGRYESPVAGLTGDRDLMRRLRELAAPGGRGLDAGCGAGARDVHLHRRAGFAAFGVDAVPAALEVAHRAHPELRGRLALADLGRGLPLRSASVDFVLCNAVVQHLPQDRGLGVALAEIGRVLRPGGVLQLMFKTGRGRVVVHDPEYGVDRVFQLYPVRPVLRRLAELGLAVIPGGDGRPGGVMRFADPKRMPHCVLFARKRGGRGGADRG